MLSENYVKPSSVMPPIAMASIQYRIKRWLVGSGANDAIDAIANSFRAAVQGNWAESEALRKGLHSFRERGGDPLKDLLEKIRRDRSDT